MGEVKKRLNINIDIKLIQLRVEYETPLETDIGFWLEIRKRLYVLTNLVLPRFLF